MGLRSLRVRALRYFHVRSACALRPTLATASPKARSLKRSLSALRRHLRQCSRCRARWPAPPGRSARTWRSTPRGRAWPSPPSYSLRYTPPGETRGGAFSVRIRRPVRYPALRQSYRQKAMAVATKIRVGIGASVSRIATKGIASSTRSRDTLMGSEDQPLPPRCAGEVPGPPGNHSPRTCEALNYLWRRRSTSRPPGSVARRVSVSPLPVCS